MCKFYSCILTKKGELLTAHEIDDSHETIVDKYGLVDKTLKDREWVRLEVTPPNGTDYDKPVADWTVEYDDHGTLPVWVEKISHAKILKLAALNINEIVIREDREELRDGRFIVCGDATIQRVYGDATIQRVYGDATIQDVRDNATITTHGHNALTIVKNSLAVVVDRREYGRVKTWTALKNKDRAI